MNVIPVPIPDHCGPACERNRNCTHFSYLNGTCRFKGGQVTPSDAYVTPGDTFSEKRFIHDIPVKRL